MDCRIMWPLRQDMSRDECKKCLRRLELDAYGSMVSVLRAQGPFCNEKQKLLQELAKVLHISNERHRAEVRRAVNDEKLTMIAEQLNGPNTGIDWTIEGRRTIPLLPRLKARNAFTTLANSISLATAVANQRPPLNRGKSKELQESEPESQTHLKLEQKLSVNTEHFTMENNFCTKINKKRPHESSNLNKSQEICNTQSNHLVMETSVTRQDRKSSPLPMPPPNKVLVLSASSLEPLNHEVIEQTFANNNALCPTIDESSTENITVIPLNVSSTEPNCTVSCKDVLSQGNSSCQTLTETNKHNTMTVPVCITNGTKTKTKITAVHTKFNPKLAPSVVLSGNISSTVGCTVQPESQDASSHDTTMSSTISPNTLKPESTNPNGSCIKRISSIIHSNIKPIVTTKSVIPGHRVLTVCPGTTVSSGPGPPYIKQPALLTCKKLPDGVLNHQTNAKMGVTLNSNKTVNISHHPNAKVGSKTNVIVIQKGHAKGVTLSHAGKEVLGKVIMGGESLRVTTQQNNNSVSVLQHVTLNNQDQTVTTLSPAALLHSESVKTNVKAGNTIVFNLRQDVLEKNRVLSHLLESSNISNIFSSESKSVIQNTSGNISHKQSNDFHVVDKEASLKADTVITSISEQKPHRKSKDAHMNMNSQVVNSVNPSNTKFVESKEIHMNTCQLTSMQDDIVDNIQIEDSMYNTEIDMFNAEVESTEINIENFEYLVDSSENHILEETESPVLSITHLSDFNDS